jgi:DNA-binding CsgD family transcriptional regulator
MRDDDYAWTPRQREVLELLASGCTNTEIADRLGISLAGAKWHVSEVISKLGVRSREQAADYWRHHNGWPTRLWRVFRTAMAAPATKWVVGSSIAGATAIVGILLAVRTGSDDRDSSSVDSQPPSAATATPETIGGVVVRRLEEAEPLPLPPNMAVYYIPAGYGKDAVLPDLHRLSRTQNGPLVDEDLFQGDLEDAYTMALDLNSGLIGVGVCEGMARGVHCGTPSYEPMGDAQPVAYVSRDLGATFTRLGDLPRGA